MDGCSFKTSTISAMTSHLLDSHDLDMIPCDDEPDGAEGKDAGGRCMLDKPVGIKGIKHNMSVLSFSIPAGPESCTLWYMHIPALPGVPTRF